MNALVEQYVEVAGRPTRLFRGGKPGAPISLFLHGGVPGITPFCNGAHIWGSRLQAFLADREIIVPDLPGSGGTSLVAGQTKFDTFSLHIIDLLDALGIYKCDVVGHDLGALSGLMLGLEQPQRFRSLSVIASQWAPPRGDGLDNLLLISPPPPLWGRESQAWALERLSYSHAHIDATLLDACVNAAHGQAHKNAVEQMREHYARTFAPGIGAARSRLWEACRDDGFKVPTQIVWASHDPSVSREAGFVLFDAIARKQSAAHFHVINRAGNFPFREEPEAFFHVVSAFQRGVLQALRPAA